MCAAQMTYRPALAGAFHLFLWVQMDNGENERIFLPGSPFSVTVIDRNAIGSQTITMNSTRRASAVHYDSSSVEPGDYRIDRVRVRTQPTMQATNGLRIGPNGNSLYSHAHPHMLDTFRKIG